MHSALKTGTLASIVAYSYLWLMALTGSIGISLPLGVFFEKKSNQPHLGSVVSTGFIIFSMVCFTTVAYMKAKSVDGPLTGNVAASQKSNAVSEAIEYLGAEVKEVNPDSIEIELKFKNKNAQDVIELDYIFILVEDINIFYRLKMRDAVYLPSNGTGVVKLNWLRSKLKNPQLFDRIRKSNSDKTLHVFAKPSKAVLSSGSVIEE